MSQTRGGRVQTTRHGSDGVRRAPARAAIHASVRELSRLAGNRAVTALVQRKVGWSDAVTKGYGWNAGERTWGKVRRIPLEGLAEGLGGGKDKLRTEIPSLSPEAAKGKAIVLVPTALDATKSIEVVVFLHGFTESSVYRPFAGLRALDPAPKSPSAKMAKLRQGVDATDVAPVRDIALDEAEQQLEESGRSQLVILIPQGGLRSEFSKEGKQDFAATPLVNEVVAQLQTEKRWYDAHGKPTSSAPTVKRVSMSGHSGAGAALGEMANRGEIEGDLALYDAINGSTQLGRFQRWVTKRLDEDLAALAAEPDEAKQLQYLQGAQKLRGYTTDDYFDIYVLLEAHINAWFKANKAKLGKLAPCVRANYTLQYVPVLHEELMRGSDRSTARAKGTGTLLDAIKLRPLPADAAACPAPLPSLADQRKAAKAAAAAAAR
jgi:hypothetical protein